MKKLKKNKNIYIEFEDFPTIIIKDRKNKVISELFITFFISPLEKDNIEIWSEGSFLNIEEIRYNHKFNKNNNNEILRIHFDFPNTFVIGEPNKENEEPIDKIFKDLDELKEKLDKVEKEILNNKNLIFNKIEEYFNIKKIHKEFKIENSNELTFNFI